MFDPWYNKGVDGIRDDYVEYITSVLKRLAVIADHVYFWGFPEIVERFIDRIPSGHKYTPCLTWYYKNNPSVISSWRSAQITCLHTSVPGVKLYSEHFLNVAPIEKELQGKLGYMPGPPSAIKSALIIGFVGKKEQAGHPSQKPIAVYSPLIEMVTKPGDLVFDPMCGSGTTGTVCRKLGRRVVLADINPKYLETARKRLELGEQKDLLEFKNDTEGFQISLPL